ncbi:hypothetical protein L1049_006498 [Liquidambar formosana]|uniref:B box-type domain-containing protein n=1 Tax=Liquidambar formosana TaxID=63359 RepID=A0AAP0RG01_LIQFO
MVGRAIPLKKEKPNWVNTLLHSKFFGSCVDHRDLRKNERNVFCIDCNLCYCKHCITSSAHCLHRWLQICRYVYHDVVRLQDMQKHLDCSKIQTYKINGEKAVHLNPRPPCKDSRPSKPKGGTACEACGRHMQDLPNRFCSIACKVSVVLEKSNRDRSHKVITFPIAEVNDLSLSENSNPEGDLSWAASSDETQFWANSALKPKKQLHKRKGVPRRAPLC